jgi:CheY-like chemotaxis protein
MAEMNDASAIAQVLNRVLSEMQGMRTRLTSLTELVQQVERMTAADAAAAGYAEQIRSGLGNIEHLLADFHNYARQLQSQAGTVARQSLADGARATDKRILVLDDERSVVELVERILKSRGYEVDTVCNGHSAVRMVEAQSYDLIICDLKMPDIGGMDVFQLIQRRHPEQARRVVFFSGDVVSPHTIAFLERTGLPFLVKPFTVRELVAFVEKAMG